MFLEWFRKAAEEPVWCFCQKGMTAGSTEAAILHRQTAEVGSFSATRTQYAVKGGRAMRVFATDGDHVGLLAEWFSLDAPYSVYTSFCCPVTEDRNCNVAGKNRLVFRAGGEGTKFFRLAGTVDGADGMEGSGLLLPDGFSAETLRFTPYSGLYGFGREHLAVFAMTRDQSDRIKGWHMEQGDGIEISAPDKCCRLRIVVGADGITLVDPVKDERGFFAYDIK